MSASRDPDRLIRAFLAEGQTDLADQVYDAVRSEIDHTSQRVFIGPWRTPFMGNTLRIGLAAAAAVLIAIVGFNLLPGGNSSGGPQATSTPTPSPSPSAQPPSIRDGSLDAGTYTLDRDLVITIEVPAGWEGCCDGFAIVSGEGPDSAVFAHDDVTNITVYGDPCHWMDSTQSEPRGAEAIAAALAAQPGREGTAPVEVSVAGTTALHVRLTVPTDLETTQQADGDSNFVGCDQEEYRTYATAAGSLRYQQGPGQIDDLYIVDVAGRTVLFDVNYFAETPQSVQAELEAMLASVRID